MNLFMDDDGGYVAWLQQNPDGFVLNTERRPRAKYLRLHRADCHFITGRPSNGESWTTHYIKVCGRRDELETWAMMETSGDVWSCPRCT